MADELDRPGRGVESHGPRRICPSPVDLAVRLRARRRARAPRPDRLSWPIAAIGAVIAVVFGFLWIREATREVRGEPAAAAARAASAEEEAEERRGRGALSAQRLPRGRDARDRRRDRRDRHAPRARLHGPAGLRRPGVRGGRPRAARELPRGPVDDHEVPARSTDEPDDVVAAHRLHPQQRPEGRRSRASRSSRTAASTSAAPSSRRG